MFNFFKPTPIEQLTKLSTSYKQLTLSLYDNVLPDPEIESLRVEKIHLELKKIATVYDGIIKLIPGFPIITNDDNFDIKLTKLQYSKSIVFINLQNRVDFTRSYHTVDVTFTQSHLVTDIQKSNIVPFLAKALIENEIKKLTNQLTSYGFSADLLHRLTHRELNTLMDCYTTLKSAPSYIIYLRADIVHFPYQIVQELADVLNIHLII